MNLSKRLHSRFYLHLGLWALSLFLGYFAFRELMLWGDSILIMSPERQLDSRWIFRIFPLSALRRAYLEYGQVNGRISQSLLNALLPEASRLFSFTPESWPVWALRASSVFILVSAPAHCISLARNRGISMAWMTAAGLALVHFWILNPLSYAPAIWMDLPLLQYFLPLFLLSIVANRGAQWGIGHLALYLFLSLCTEHYFVATPILLLAFAVIASPEKQPLTVLKERLPWYVGLSLIAVALYLASPGQHWRNGVFAQEFQPLYTSLWDWMLKYQAVGYQTLFLKTLSPFGYVVTHIVFFIAVLATLWHGKKRGKRATFDLSVLSLAFLLSYQGCLTTTLVASYFPYYCVFIPDLFLLLAIVFWVLALTRHLKVPGMISNSSATAISLALLYGIVLKAPLVAQDYHEVVQHSRMRRWISSEIREKAPLDRQFHFSIVGFPTTSFGSSVEYPWALRGYLDWVGLPKVTAAVETGEQNGAIEGERYVISYANCPWKLKTRAISQLHYGFFR